MVANRRQIKGLWCSAVQLTAEGFYYVAELARNFWLRFFRPLQHVLLDYQYCTFNLAYQVGP